VAVANNGYAIDSSEARTRPAGTPQTTHDLIETSIKIIEPIQPITVRGVAYKLFEAGHIDSMAVKNYQKVSRILRETREQGLLPWEWIVDESRELESQPSWANPASFSFVGTGTRISKKHSFSRSGRLRPNWRSCEKDSRDERLQFRQYRRLPEERSSVSLHLERQNADEGFLSLPDLLGRTSPNDLCRLW
jgi:hypothetical protein